MLKVSCAVIGFSSSTYGIHKRKKEPCLVHADKNVIKGQCLLTVKDLLVFTVFQLK